MFINFVESLKVLNKKKKKLSTDDSSIFRFFTKMKIL